MNANYRIGTLLAVATVALSVIFSVPASAQEKNGTPDFTIGKKGVIHFNVPVKVGSDVLQPGMYQVQHAVEGGDHVVSFKAMEMPAGYRHSNTPVAKHESTRVKCTVEAVDKKVTRTTITLRTNAGGEKVVSEVLIAGEAFKHIL